jgi:hypothetical protein
MKTKKSLKLFISVSLVLLVTANLLQAQEAITSTGNNATGTGGSVSYSVGQIVCNTISSVSYGSIAQGVQQPFEISVVSGIEDEDEINLMISVFPNPTGGFLTLNIDVSFTSDLKSLDYKLYDMNGNLVKFKEITEYITSIDMSNFIPATYFLSVNDSGKVVKTFKIIKNQ